MSQTALTIQQDQKWEKFWSEIEKIKELVRAVVGLQVGSSVIKTRARLVVQSFFRDVKQTLPTNLDTSKLDPALQDLLRLANSRGSKSRYIAVLRRIIREKVELEVKRELTHIPVPTTTVIAQDRREHSILQTLESILPTSALSYKQVMLDLLDTQRFSYRGAAHELRDVLREVLDHLAPDKSVMAVPGFALEQDCEKPTMKQKVKFVMAARSMSRNALTTTVHTTDLVDELVGSLARATYNRGSGSAHGNTNEIEVRQIKQYVEVLLCELLAIPV